MPYLLLVCVLVLSPCRAQIIPGFDMSVPDCHFAVVDYNGQPALLLWKKPWARVVEFHQAPPPPFQRVRLDVVMAMASDSRPCAVGNIASLGAYSLEGGARLATIPASGSTISVPVTGTGMQRWSEPEFTTHFMVHYCPEYCCGNCAPCSYDEPEFWALLCTIRLR